MSAAPEFSTEFRERVRRQKEAAAERKAREKREQQEQNFPTPLMRETAAPEAYPIDALGPLLGPAARAIGPVPPGGCRSG